MARMRVRRGGERGRDAQRARQEGDEPRRRLPGWLAGRWEIFDRDSLGGVATWVAAGFTALTGVLTFFGVKEGTLDRILRVSPPAALLVFCLVGGGVLLGVLAPVLDKRRNIPALFVLAPVAAAAVLARRIFPDFPAPADLKADGADHTQLVGQAATVLLALLGVAALLLLLRSVSATGGLLVLALSLTSMGLYGAAKLSVRSKSYVEAARVGGQFVTVDGRELLRVSTTVGRREPENITVVRAQGVRTFLAAAEEPPPEVLGVATLTPDAAGDVEATSDFPVDRSRWSRITVLLCEVAKQDLSAEMRRDPCDTGKEVLRFENAAAGRPVVGGTLTPAAGTVTAAVSAARLQADAHLDVSVARRAGGPPAAEGSAVPSATGEASWTSPVTVAAGDVVVLSYRVCYGPCPAATPWVQAARLTVAAR